MQKIYSQQDRAANGHAVATDIVEEATGIPPSSESGDQDTGIRSQTELEELRVALEERIAYLEPKLRETYEQYRQAEVVIAQLSNEVLQLKAQLYDELSARLANED